MTLPSNFPEPVYNFATNQVTPEGFELGRRLFYDTRLSRNNTISCGSCHQQFAAFSHSGHIVSHGINDLLGKRNAPAIMNMAWNYDFFWDGGVHSLDLVPPNPIKNPVEMDAQFSEVLDKLRATTEYPALFKAAFGTEEINSVRFLQAMSQFMNCLVSANSKYDKYVRGEGATLSEDELAGKELFTAKCAVCHSTDLFTDRSFHNNGIQATVTDSGRYLVTLDPLDIGKFKTPSLRNIEKTGPYMHSGKFQTLQSVLDHYSDGIHNTPTLDNALITNGQPGIAMTAEEKAKIIAFLLTLTDKDFITDPRFSE
ncbi:MAG: cytochrome c peroxidase [Chitinophagales bacterium]